MDITCPHCGTEYDAEDGEYGKFVKCAICGQGFVAGTSAAKRIGNNAAQLDNGFYHGKSGGGQSSVMCRIWGSIKSQNWLALFVVLALTGFKLRNQIFWWCRTSSPQAVQEVRQPRDASESNVDISRWCRTSSSKASPEVRQPRDDSENKVDINAADVIVQKRLREMAVVQLQEKATEAKIRRNENLGMVPMAGFTIDDHVVYSGDRPGGWAWKDKKEKGAMSFVHDLEYAFETMTGYSADTRTEQEKLEDEILGKAIADVRNRYQKRLRSIGLDEVAYRESNVSCSLSLCNIETGETLGICYNKASQQIKSPSTISKRDALSLIQDRRRISDYEYVVSTQE